MIKATTGGAPVVAAYLGMSESSLDNRIYQRKGQELSTKDSLLMQDLSGTTHFAEAVAHVSGGVFVRIPDAAEQSDNSEILERFLALTAHYGALAKRHQEATSDGEVDGREMADLERISQDIHRVVEEINALTRRIYCRADASKAAK
jgi:hypothetical protein